MKNKITKSLHALTARSGFALLVVAVVLVEVMGVVQYVFSRNGIRAEVENTARTEMKARTLEIQNMVASVEVAVGNILGKSDRMRYNAIPGVVYTNPEVAGVGLTEGEAKAQGIDHVVVKLPMAYSGRFVAENEGGEGLCKIICGKKYHEVLGVHMLGNPCSEILASACIAIETEMTVEQLKEVVFPHPTVSEIIKETAFSLK